MAVVIERDMAITWEEFQRMVPAAAGDVPYVMHDRSVEFELSPSDRLRVVLGKTGVRRIASISLPSTPVTFTFEGGKQRLLESFLERFDRYFQRGGG